MNSFPLGGIISLLIFLPNLLLFISPPKKMNDESDSTNGKNFITIFERTGQASCFVLPFLYHLPIPSIFNEMMLTMMAVILSLYYVCWARFFMKGRGMEWFYRPLFGMILPMAVLPVLYFLIAAVFLQSLWLFIVAVVFAIGHLTESWIQFQKICKIL
jgi:hypothetical protein